jgi:HAD superfamily hydrolase (TIGR01490 family)
VQFRSKSDCQNRLPPKTLCYNLPMTPAKIGAFFDIDGTLTADNVWKGIMKYFTGRGERRLTHLRFWAMHYPVILLRYVGLVSETTFRRQWALHLPWYFADDDPAQMQKLAQWVAHDYVTACQRPDVLAVLRRHLDEGHTVALVSGAPTPVVQAIAAMWKVPHALGSPAEFKDGRYTGGMTGEPCIDAEKARLLKSYLANQNIHIDSNTSYAYADSYSDLGLFEMVGNPVAVYPDKELTALAKERGWKTIPG